MHITIRDKVCGVGERCHQAPSHYLNQCWPSFMMPSGYSLRDNELNKWHLFHMHITIRDKVCGVGERCHQAPSHYLNQCWPSFMMPSGYSLRDNELNEWHLFHMHVIIRDKVCGVGEMYNPTYIYIWLELGHPCRCRCISIYQYQAISRHTPNYIDRHFS